VTLRESLAEERSCCVVKMTYIYFRIWKMFHSMLCLFLLESYKKKRKEIGYITTESFILCLPLVSNCEKVPFLWSLRKNWIRSRGFWANGHRSTSVAVAVVERRRFDRNGQRYSNRYQFRQSRETGTSGLPNCLRIMLQPERTSGFKKFLILSCFFVFFFYFLFLFCLFFVLFLPMLQCRVMELIY